MGIDRGDQVVEYLTLKSKKEAEKMRRRDDNDFYEDEKDEWDEGAIRYENRRDWMDYKRHVAGRRESVNAWLFFFAALACTIVAFTMFPFALVGTFAFGIMWIISGISAKIKRWYWRR